MKKRIYRHMLLLTLLSLLLLTTLLSLVFYQITRESVIRDVQEKATLLQAMVSEEGDALARIASLSVPEVDARLTVIAPDGSVLIDNAASPGALENHAGREEFQQALSLSVGESTRFSSTLSKLTYYYALRLPDGNVLRLSRTIASIQGILTNALPVLVLILGVVFLLGNLLASRLTKRILQPLQTLDPQEGVAVYDELSSFTRTIARQKDRIQEQVAHLTKRADMINVIVSNMREGFVLLDPHGIILLANPAALALLKSPQSMEGKNIVELLRTIEILDSAKAALRGEHRECALTLNQRHFHVYCTPSAEGGAMLLFVDTTDKARAEKARAEFSANVSHELTTPLTSIYGYAEMLSKNMVEQQDIARFSSKIVDEVKRLIALIEDITRLSQLDETASIPDLEPVALRTLAYEAVEQLAHLAAEREIRIDVEGEDLAPLANRVMMHELLYNLIQNAIRYNKLGGSVCIRIERQGNFVALSVQDTGIGIPRAHQDHVFERFYRVDKSRSKKTGGTGLGLAIVKHIVLVHGGRISIVSEEGQGATILVELPARTCD